MDLASLSLMGGAVPVRVSTHPRARRMALRIDPQGEAVDLVLPPRSSLPRALAFFEDNRPWLERRLAALPPRTMFAEGALVCRITLTSAAERRCAVRQQACSC